VWTTSLILTSSRPNAPRAPHPSGGTAWGRPQAVELQHPEWVQAALGVKGTLKASLQTSKGWYLAEVVLKVRSHLRPLEFAKKILCIWQKKYKKLEHLFWLCMEEQEIIISKLLDLATTKSLRKLKKL
jgi:hypothetical protein